MKASSWDATTRPVASTDRPVSTAPQDCEGDGAAWRSPRAHQRSVPRRTSLTPRPSECRQNTPSHQPVLSSPPPGAPSDPSHLTGAPPSAMLPRREERNNRRERGEPTNASVLLRLPFLRGPSSREGHASASDPPRGAQRGGGKRLNDSRLRNAYFLRNAGFLVPSTHERHIRIPSRTSTLPPPRH